MPKACSVSKLRPVILPMMTPAAAALNPAVAQARPNTRGTEMPTDMDANWSSDTARMEMPTVDFLKNHENPPIITAVTITPTSWVQEMDTPPKDIKVWGKNLGKEKFTDPKGVRKIKPSMMDIRPIVTMITEMIGSPIKRRKKIRSTLIARKKVITILRKKDI